MSKVSGYVALSSLDLSPTELALTLQQLSEREDGVTLAFAFCKAVVSCALIMRPSSLGGGRIMRRTLSVCLSVRLSVRPSRCRCHR